MGQHLAIQPDSRAPNAATGPRKWIKPITISALAPPEWDDFTQRWARKKIAEARIDLPAELRAATDSCRPVNVEWLAARLKVVWKSTIPTSSMEAKDWLHETGRLTKHLPQDIAGHAIDEAVKASRFTPTAGDILAIAEPLLVERRKQRQRLDVLVNGDRRPEAPWQRDSEPPQVDRVCTPEEAAAIMAECGIGRVEEQRVRYVDGRNLRGPKQITVQDYVDLGLSREDAERAVAGFQASGRERDASQ